MRYFSIMCCCELLLPRSCALSTARVHCTRAVAPADNLQAVLDLVAVEDPGHEGYSNQ